MPTGKRVLQSILPPVLWNAGKGLKRRMFRSVDHMALAPEGWATPLPSKSAAYWKALVTRQQAECELLSARVRRGEPLLNAGIEDIKHVIFGYVLATIARRQSHIAVLDYGASLGDYYWIALALVPGVSYEYHGKELPQLAAAGREISPAICWHTDDACLERRYDLVMFSGVLPYLPDWPASMRKAADATNAYLLVTDVPAVSRMPGFVATQRSDGERSLYQVLNRDELIDTIKRTGLRLVREFELGSHPRITHAPEQPISMGWLFQRQ